MFLARKISLPKWKQHPDLAEGEIRADAVTIASRIAKAVRDRQRRRFRRRAVLDLLADAVELDRIKINYLKCPLRQQVQKHLDERGSQRKNQP